MSFWDAYPWSPVLIVGLIALGFGFCFFICRCTYSIYMKFEKCSNVNIPTLEPAVNQIYTTHDDEVPTTDAQTMTSHYQTIENDTSNQETYPPLQQDLTGDVLPLAYDTMMSDDKLGLWSTNFPQK